MAFDPILVVLGVLAIFLIGGTLGLILGIVLILAGVSHYGYGRR